MVFDVWASQLHVTIAVTFRVTNVVTVSFTRPLGGLDRVPNAGKACGDRESLGDFH